MQSTAKKYFETYAFEDIRHWVRFLGDQVFDECVVIPARKESQDFSATLESLKAAADGKKILVILVVNASIDSDEQTISDNLNLILQLAGRKAIQEAISLVKKDDLHLCIINRSIAPFLLPLKSGVGLARKMGADFAARLAEQKRIRSPWIYSTDADAVLPTDYFSALPENTSSVVFPFIHESSSQDPHTKLATKIYDLFLHYYPAGLRFAGSSYAFHTIGSCLAFRWETYLKVRGFPVREAAEDFYFLNKAAKIGKVRDASIKPIRLSGRLSDRVPFGTGPSIRKNILSLRSGREIEFYDPEIFWVLKSLLSSFEVFVKTRKVKSWQESFLQDERRGLWILRICEEMKMPEAFEGLATKNPKAANLELALSIWFDGFRTLKFIHRVRDLYLPSIPWFDAIKAAPFETTALSGRRTPSKPIRSERDHA